MKSIFVILSAIILLQGISGYSTHEYQSYVAKNVNGFATVEGVVSKDGVTKKFYKVIPEYSSADSIPGDKSEFVFPDPIKIPDIKIPEFTHFQEPIQVPTPNWNPFSVNDHMNKFTQDIFEQNKKIHDSISSNFLNSFPGQTGFGNTFSNQPDFGNTFSNQPGFGNAFSNQPGFGNTFASQPYFGNSFAFHPGFGNSFSQPGFNTFSQPGFGNAYSSYPDFGNSFSAQSDFGNTFPQFSFENAGNTFYYPEYPQLNYWL